jgi:hypothetical protein
MSESDKEKIKLWLSEEGKFDVKEEPKPETHFFLRVDYKLPPTSIIPLFIFAPREEKIDKIVVLWKWSLLPEYRESFLAINDSVKNELRKDIECGFMLMHLLSKFTPNIEYLQSIEAQKVIRIDGLTKDRLFDVMTQVHDGFAFIMLQFQKYNFWPPSFDPSQLP